jgi:alkylation response protein AidB-like acyl-CoA dehydrogenase
MRFDLNDEQKLLQQTARDFFAAESSSPVVRKLFAEDRFGREIWEGMAAQGWLGALIDEEHGGLGLSMADMFPILEEAGRMVAPVPLVESAVVSPTLIRCSADPGLAAEWLPRIAEGELIATVALYEDADIVEPTRISVAGQLRDEGWVLDGVKELVPFGADADLFLVLARTTPEEIGLAGLTLFAVPRQSAGLTASSIPFTDPTYRFAKVEFKSVVVPSQFVLGEADRGAQALKPSIRDARVALCAETVGGCEKVVAMCVDYAKQRVQFDRPIGSFQAIKHKLADMHANLESIRGLAYAATAALESEETDDPIVEVAKAMCDDAYRFISSEGIQVHGGIGFTWEHDVHFYYKRALRYSNTLGTSRQLMYEVGARLSQGQGFEEFEPVEGKTRVPVG